MVGKREIISQTCVLLDYKAILQKSTIQNIFKSEKFGTKL